MSKKEPTDREKAETIFWDAIGALVIGIGYVVYLALYGY